MTERVETSWGQHGNAALTLLQSYGQHYYGLEPDGKDRLPLVRL